MVAMALSKTACILRVESTELTLLTQSQALTEALSSFSIQAWTEYGLSTAWLRGRHRARRRETKAHKTWFSPLGAPHMAGDTQMHTHTYTETIPYGQC